ncbi:hypothetical protein NLJ89_g2532 [Agrocybe chaxingu]|uniref:AB hydrolase-1 domain-containing protein n=1 Tax=Agrocybe chaxingu TaxID=84603 RepID=A0A9W8K6M2_9AGAR|nr:hypothetical protein NLJ89_g2532 [Agrocybe chaxingu]
MATKFILSLLAVASLVQSIPLIPRANVWETLPPTPLLPAPINNVKAPINGVNLWFQKYNEARGGTPIVLIHGGLGYSAYFGDVVSRLMEKHYVIAVDRRGHGRSTFNAADTFTFEMFAKDTDDLLKAQGVSKAVWVGWSDGAATTLAGLLDSTINRSITKAFVFGGFQKPSDTNATFTDTSVYSTFVSRCATEYAQLQPGVDFMSFATKVATLEGTLPNWTDAQLAKIDGSKVTVAGAEHEEAVNLAVAPHLASVIPRSKLVILPDVSHFAPVQNPAQFTAAIEAFLVA